MRHSIQVIKQRVVGEKILAPQSDELAIEDPIELLIRYRDQGGYVEDKPFVTLRTPGNDDDLIRGLLFSQGRITRPDEIVQIRYTGERAHAAPTQAIIELNKAMDARAAQLERSDIMQSSCGFCGSSRLRELALPARLKLTSTWQVDCACLHTLPTVMFEQQEAFSKTGGLHASSLFTQTGQLLAVREDIGRHNALDKAIGACLVDSSIALDRALLCSSGRISYEIIQKALMAGISVVMGVGAPSSLAVTLATDFNLTLLGFARDGRFNVYSGPERLLSEATSRSQIKGASNVSETPTTP